MENNTENKVALENLDLPYDLKYLNIQQCSDLCREIRDILIRTVSKNGGHLASNLGAVELTLALHRVFNSPNDKIVWDVGHQSYTHKLLTGRLSRFDTLRTEGGISGFPKPEESEHDAFVGGHSSTSISAAFGMAQAMKLEGSDNYAVAVTGDGALTGGEIYEGLNNAGKSDVNLIVVLNHNNMSISKNVGALAKYLMSIRNTRKYVETKRAVEKALTKTPIVGKPVAKVLKKSKDTVKSSIYKNTTIFEDLGFVYLGPVNGHSISEMEEAFETAKSYHRPVVIHVNTVKGKGYMPAEKNPGGYHGISKFDVATGNPEISAADSFSDVFGRELLRLGKDDDRICAVTAAMKYGTGLQYFASECPERFFDVGIAEPHAVTFSCGLAASGKIPVFAVYSSFLQRAIDQLIHDVSIGKNHIVIGIDRAGAVGEDGETHQGLFDVSLITPIPGAVIYSPSCYEELRMCLQTAIYDHRGLVCVRYPRGKDESVYDKTALNTEYTFSGDRNADTLIITYGRIYNQLLQAAEILAADGIRVCTLKLTRILPIDDEIIHKSMRFRKIFFFEEGMVRGGCGEHFEMMLYKNGYNGRFYTKGAETFIKQAPVKRILQKLGLDCEGIAAYVKEITDKEVTDNAAGH